MGDNRDMDTPASRQVLREFLFTRAQEFVKTDPNTSGLSRADRRAVARQVANRIAKQGLEENRNGSV